MSIEMQTVRRGIRVAAYTDDERDVLFVALYVENECDPQESVEAELIPAEARALGAALTALAAEVECGMSAQEELQ